MINVCIAGATGYTGLELIKIVKNHPKIKLNTITSDTYNGKAFNEVFPEMDNFDDLVFEELKEENICLKSDVVFLALPHKVSMKYVPKLLENNTKVIDLSADYRFSNAKIYESAYQKHSSKNLLKKAVYGLSEIYADEIKKAYLVGNPGCYPTSILLPLLPLLKEKFIKNNNIIADSKSGVSGAGKASSSAVHFCTVNESFKAYKVGNHRHTPEINEILSIYSKKKTSISFVPHLLPLTRGMLSTIYAQLEDNIDTKDIKTIYDSYYNEKPFIRIKDIYPEISHVKGTNFCDIGFYVDSKAKKLIVICAIDNLLKGAAGQAVQNMNLMFGFPETLGLDVNQGYL